MGVKNSIYPENGIELLDGWLWVFWGTGYALSPFNKKEPCGLWFMWMEIRLVEE
jgi:hypothetical protein